jgi:predicted NAD/FAD-dependent oxidoreductase
MTSMAQSMADGLHIETSVKIESMRESRQQWVLSAEHGTPVDGIFDHVVFAIPAPQIPPILGKVAPSWADRVLGLEMLACWTVMATTDASHSAPFDAVFVNGGPLSWVANNASKPGRPSTPIWTLHASADWSQAHLEDDPDEVIRTLVTAFEAMSGARVTEAVGHRWRYAKAHPCDRVESLWDPARGLGACGDWLATGTLEGAWLSGQDCAQKIGNVPIHSGKKRL